MQQIDPIESLAMSVEANPGVYALLLGSGVSRSASIPTGWEVVLDLVQKLATMRDEECGDDPAQWYRERFDVAPGYTTLLEELANTPTERQQLLRSYFEPNDEDREQGLKQPTQAHRAIAKLVAGGHVRVILTTNMDRLVEQAIQDEGIAPSVVSTPDQAEGMVPLIHQRCCVVKLHGDYLDPRIKNTDAELETYDPAMDRLLDQVLDQFGLIVCGWSARWDIALRKAIERCPARRFSLFWATRSEPDQTTQKLVTHRAARVIRIEDADSFFDRLAELVAALQESKRHRPDSVEAAIALVKRYLPDPRYAIKLDDMIHEEQEDSRRRLTEFAEEMRSTGERTVKAWYGGLRAAVERIQHLLIHGCALGKPEHETTWVKAVEHVARWPKSSNVGAVSSEVSHYPIVVVLYASGLAAMARQHDRLVARLLTEPRLIGCDGPEPLVVALDWWGIGGWLENTEEHRITKHVFPLSEHLFGMLREPLRRFLPDDAEYEDCFDRFEYVRSLVYADISGTDAVAGGFHFPDGRFVWKLRRRDHNRINTVLEQFDREVESAGDDSPLLQLGLFDGSVEKFKEICPAIHERVSKLSPAWD